MFDPDKYWQELLESERKIQSLQPGTSKDILPFSDGRPKTSVDVRLLPSTWNTSNRYMPGNEHTRAVSPFRPRRQSQSIDLSHVGNNEKKMNTTDKQADEMTSTNNCNIRNTECSIDQNTPSNILGVQYSLTDIPTPERECECWKHGSLEDKVATTIPPLIEANPCGEVKDHAMCGESCRLKLRSPPMYAEYPIEYSKTPEPPVQGQVEFCTTPVPLRARIDYSRYLDSPFSPGLLEDLRERKPAIINPRTHPICSDPDKCCKHKHLSVSNQHITEAMAEKKKKAMYRPNEIPQPFYRCGKQGAPWRHIDSCYNMIGNHCTWINGLVKQKENKMWFPDIYKAQTKFSSLKPKVRLHSASTNNIYHEHAKSGFNYWDIGAKKNGKAIGKKNIGNKYNWLGVGSGDNLAALGRSVLLY